MEDDGLAGWWKFNNILDPDLTASEKKRSPKMICEFSCQRRFNSLLNESCIAYLKIENSPVLEKDVGWELSRLKRTQREQVR